MTNFENERVRINNLLTAGKITAEDHENLLAALGNQSGFIDNAASFLMKPFKSVS